MAEYKVGSVVMDGDDYTDQGFAVRHKSIGSKAVNRDLNTLVNLWTPLTQMLQVAPGHHWCKTCGDARPYSYFDVLEWGERGHITAVDSHGKPVAWDGVRFPAKYADECKQCMNARDPRLRPTLFCSRCRHDKRREEFGDDERTGSGKKYICKVCAADLEHERRERKALAQGRQLRDYQWAR